MSIDAVGASSTLATTTNTQAARGRHHGGPPLSQTAELLGTNTDDLQSQLRSGTTLEDLATQKGVSKDDLLSAIQSDLKAGKPEGAPELSETQLAEMAQGIASGQRPGGPGGPGGPPPGGPPPSRGTDASVSNNLSSLADALGTDPDQLRTMLSSVEDLGDLLAKSGITGYGSAGNGAATSSLAVDRYA